MGGKPFARTIFELTLFCQPRCSFLLHIAQFLVILAAIVLGYSWTSAAMFSAEKFIDSKHPSGADLSGEDEQPEPPRNFTLSQLSQFDGKKDGKSNQDKPVYLSMNGIVFDVSKGRDFYGPGGPYEKVGCWFLDLLLAVRTHGLTPLDDSSIKLSLRVTSVV
jgi:hypothetical protein